MQTDIDPRTLIGRKAFDCNGAKIGTVDEVYLDDATGEPEWAAVRTGLFSRDAFVPLEPSELVDDALRVPFERSLIRGAPDFGVGRHLSPEQELELYRHYGIEVPGAADPTRPGGTGTPPDVDFGHLAAPTAPERGAAAAPPSGDGAASGGKDR
ncbi:PRC-barrel domain-containing protein [Streptomyces lonarensis]|uniref:PRC-barrel domain containing protein n=1 Tax=Streptomyces lonarensis TaxID=700599 RepID=A0A7X6CXF5_9ACTN|nr:PRC-barrel domain-containing protein [Streptomyces lonarensis]NJQ04371.1 PRC-barrel domain containing protein [Streptomyces lonarensis]